MNITITVTEQEMSMLFQALGELPLKISGPLFSKLQQQAVQQAQQARERNDAADHSTREF